MAAETNGGQHAADEHNLLTKIIPHLDRHLVFPLLNDMDPSRDIDKLKFELLKHTNMTDFVGDLEMELKGLSERPAEYDKRREEVLKTRQKYTEDTEKLTTLLESEEVVNNLRSDKVANLAYLKDNHGVTPEMVTALYDYGGFLYSCGAYGESAELLYKYRVLSTDNDKVAAATWGKLASEILTTEWDQALEEITKVREVIDTKFFANPLAQLYHRTWLLHWCLFPFFNYDNAREPLTELFFSPAYINTIQTLCPWILRYLTAAVVTNRSKIKNTNAYQKQIKDLIRVVKQEGYEYTDPLTDFIKALYVDFDFEEAQKKLGEAEQILTDDFFLGSCAVSFVECARHLISESYCKIHQRIDIKDLSARLGLSASDGEKWIVNLIRDTRVDAKIDYQEGTVVMNHPPQSVYQQVIERTKGGFFRTQVLSAAVAK